MRFAALPVFEAAFVDRLVVWVEWVIIWAASAQVSKTSRGEWARGVPAPHLGRVLRTGVAQAAASTLSAKNGPVGQFVWVVDVVDHHVRSVAGGGDAIGLGFGVGDGLMCGS